MGASVLGIIPQATSFLDPKVCRFFLCGLCPFELFINTKMDFGACPGFHIDKLKLEYQQQSQVSYQKEWFLKLKDFVNDCDKKIKASQLRLDKTPEDKKIADLVFIFNLVD